ncbi:3-keto-disaccharide hydrolase [Neorhodopirellula pilleata]|uniref:3-keto-alpha-glucoside-1,2-lyase/3-keto-2-hydroxy-glucal hydratase domain-containing protein n=1 Tax=Neorhodopirellula pilleata TaxID=2714738 RepID=A0A5C6A4C5_9BACT|nr:DUF1080 domain-containing protein [Neorhodopirellula pilleata]TWT94220.1 hypothetical protein Pla100_38300 [Neorhodopirellula pilleata]
MMNFLFCQIRRPMTAGLLALMGTIALSPIATLFADTQTASPPSDSAAPSEVKAQTDRPAEAPQPESTVRSLFDGKTLDGWKNPYEWGKIEIIDGEIKLTADKKFFLVTDKVYHDYEFEGELKLPEGKSNSGFMARGQVEPNRVFGYQAEADPTDRRWSGGLYDEGRRQWLNPLWNQPEAQAAFDRNRWNRYRIRCVGNHLQFFVNDVPTTDYFDPVDLSGHIALQHHGEKDQTYRFRNLTVKELGRHEWKPIFNSEILGRSVPEGETIPGFKSVGGGVWTVVDGILQGRASSEANEPNGMLYSTKQYTDATFRIVYRFAEGNSGFFVRSEITEAKPFVKGVQCEIDGSEQVGGLYQTGGKGWVAEPLHYLEKQFPPDRRDVVRSRWTQARAGIPLDDMKAKPKKQPEGTTESSNQSIDDSPWQTMVVSFHGKRIVTHLNGCLVTDAVVEDLADSGVIALQLHGNQDLAVDFKSLEILAPVQ